MTDATRALSSPTSMGQTQHLVKLDGACVAAVCWEGLPYYLRSVWGSRAEAARPERLRSYLESDASPVALALAARSARLDDSLRDLARRRLGALGVLPAALERLERHFARLLRSSRSRLLTHLSVAERADPELDRLDLLAEIVALRDAQADVQAERSLARAFRAMFVTRDPFVVWIIVCLSFASFIAFSKSGSPGAQALYNDLSLEPGLARPWTLFTYVFLHQLDDWRHVTLNMLALALVGQVLEQVLGH
ncbi:MAG: rhomboid family intramembrane serine protease, partial [Myxococcales bacterium]|nr:rhomboid family intramembrane serine protease [Myxococcales bacterium]